MRILGLRTRNTSRAAVAAAEAAAAASNPKPGAADPNTAPKDTDEPGAVTDPENEPESSEGNPEDLDENGLPRVPTPPADAAATAPAAGLTGSARIKAILQAPGASAQRDLAEYLALDTDIDSAVAGSILGKVKATAPAAAPAAGAGAGKPNAFLAAMDKVANPKTPAASASAPKAGSPEAAVSDLTSTFRKFGLSR